MDFLLPLLQYGLGKEPDLPDTPNLLDLAKNEADKQLVRYHHVAGAGRGAALSVPPWSTARTVLPHYGVHSRKCFTDPAFIDEGSRSPDFTLDPIPGRGTAALRQ